MDVVETLTVQPGCSSQENLEERSARIGKCEVCAFKDFKYTCPKCEVKTCSLQCNKIHKLELECDGNRDRTKYIPLKQFTDIDFESDFKLLESVSEGLSRIKKKFEKRYNSHVIPKCLLRLRNAAELRKTTLMYLPFKFNRHKTNTTILDFKSGTILWHIQWVFVNAENLHLSDSRVSENEKWSTVLTGISGLTLLLKAEQQPGKKFYELDHSLSIKESLSRKLIIEYPTVHVLLEGHSSGYDVLDSDEEMDTSEDTETGNQIIQKILVKAESDENLYESLKNLLFISEYSDEECKE
ncbi:box C/D snoRNA protein 1 isoform X2 [Euwallacea fornicatus]|uniref:box C/D snoRNA protein 1 isoform X2 n=1 Tax=Euwallacea fornicatus TaxID=995702 RepID=UPI0033900A4A